MTDFRERYKRIGYGREDLEANRALRSQRRDEARREMRSEHFSLRRDMGCSSDDQIHLDDSSKPEPSDNTPDQPVESAPADPELDVITKRTLELEKWREEKKLRRLCEKKKAKPIFKVGVVHHKMYSPPTIKDPAPVPTTKLCKKQSQPEPPVKRVTKATEKRLAIKAVNNQQKREIIRKKKENPKLHVEEGLAQVPLAPDNHQFKAPLGLTAIPMFGRHALEATKENMSPTSTTNELHENDFNSVVSFNKHSFILSSNAHLNFQEPNVQTCDSTSFVQNMNDSLNSTGEAISLKVSSDDQELLNDQDSIVNIASPKKHSVSRRSSPRSQKQSFAMSTSINESDQINSDIKQIQEDEYDQNNVTKNLSVPNNLNESKRKSRVPLLETESSIISESVSNVVPEIESNISIDSKSSRKNKMNLSIRRSSRRVADKISSPKLSKNISSKVGNQVMEEPMDTTTSITETQLVDGRKSTRKLTRNNAIEKSIQEATLNQSSIENLEINRSLNRTMENGTVKYQGIRRSARILADSSAATKEESRNKNIFGVQAHTDSNDKHVTNFSSNPNAFNDSVPDKRSVEFLSPQLPINIHQIGDQFDIEVTTTVNVKLSPQQIATKVKHHNFKLSPKMQQVPTHLDSHINPKIDLPVNEKNINSLDTTTALIKDSTVDQTPAIFSPFIVSSRGKSSMRKEVKRRRFSQVSPEDIPTKDTVMKGLNISVEEEERTAQYYKYILDKEIERLNERCDTWNAVKDSGSIPEDANYTILAAIGHTQLLMRKKFERFRSLVLDCETGKGEMLVTCKDLQGFWEMMYREIKDCDNRFDKLEELRSKNWVEDEIEEPEDIQPKMKVVKKKVVNKKPVATAKSSSLRAHILALRKKKMEEESSSGIIDQNLVKESNDTETNNMEPKKPNGNESPIINERRRTSTPRSTTKWQSLVNKVQMSQSRKSATSPLIVMKLSQMCKTPEVHLDESIVYINSDRTPAKSILKTSKDDIVASVAKSTNKVFFKEQPMEVQEFHDSYNNTDDRNDVKESIERRLDFENDSFNLLDIENEEAEDKTPTVLPPIVSPSPFCSPNKSTRLSVPKIVKDEASPLNSISPLSLTDKNPPLRRSSIRTKKHISFRDDLVKTEMDSDKNSKLVVQVTPRPSRVKTPLKSSTKLKNDVDMEGNAATGTNEEQNVGKKLYLNSDGIICEGIIQAQKRTPKMPLRRSNSARTPQAKNETLGLDTTNNNPPSTSRLRRRNTQLVNIDTSVSEEIEKKTTGILTPQVRRRNSKRSFAETTSTEENMDFSPFIVSSRGKSSTRKEVKRRFSQVSPEDIPTKDTVMKVLNISVEEEERTAQYYKYILDKEIERLNERCDTWNAVKDSGSIPEDASYTILAAVGHTQLLMRKKFERFRSLVLDCETGKGEMLVTCKDLQGFWEMMYREIKDCDNRFDKLEELRSKNWVEDEIEEPEDIQPKMKVVKKKVVNKKPVATAKSSSLRAHILALRKKKMEEESSSGIIDQNLVKESNDTETNNMELNKPNGNESPIINERRRTSTPRSTTKWQSLVNKVQMSQSRKSATSPLIMMKLSQMCKTPEVNLDESIVYVNSDRTPAKSILKTSNDDIVASVAKSTNKVLFKEQPMEVQEFHDSYNNTDDRNDVKEPIERRLDFEDDSFNLLDIENEEAEDKTPTVLPPIVSLSPFCSPNKSTRLSVPKIVIDEASPLISMSPLSLTDKNSPLKRSSIRTKKHISFRDDLVKTEMDSDKNSKLVVQVTPRPSRVKTPLKSSSKLNNDVDMEGNAAAGTNEEQNVVKELYLNSDGIICERIIQAQKSTPKMPLRRSNSARTPQAKNKTLGLDTTNNNPPSTSRLRRRNTQLVNIDTSVSEEVEKKTTGILTPQVRRRNSKRSFAETTLTEENMDITLEDKTPKLKKNAPTTLNATDVTGSLNDSLQSSTKSKLRRTKSLTHRSRKSTPTLANSIQESLTPAADTNSMASSIKRSSKKMHKSEENNDTLSSTPFTPDTRRKSTRIAQARSEDGNC